MGTFCFTEGFDYPHGKTPLHSWGNTFQSEESEDI